MNIINCLTKTIGILVLFNICLFLIPRPIKKLINVFLNGVNKLFTILFEYIEGYCVDNFKKEVSPKSSNVVKFKRRAK